jgi:hypothetical protein
MMSYANEMDSLVNLLLSQVRLELMVASEVENWTVIGRNWIQFPGSFWMINDFTTASFFKPPQNASMARASAYHELKQEAMNGEKTCRGRSAGAAQRFF